MVATGTILSSRYMIQAEIGAGGMGTVYRAVDLRTGALVALKVPHTFLLRDELFTDRLIREARVAATIQSHRIARVTDVSLHDETPYIVMEYVQGETLADLIARQGALDPVQALQITLEVARALMAAHEAGVVHRDLKPPNIFLSPDATAESLVKVIDFGIAREVGASTLTAASKFVGTPEYAAPERLEGESDIRSDIYSVGVILHEALTGNAPFRGTTPWVVMRQHASQPPPPLPDDVPRPVQEIVDRCLAKRPEDRFQTPLELSRALQEVLASLGRNSITASQQASTLLLEHDVRLPAGTKPPSEPAAGSGAGPAVAHAPAAVPVADGGKPSSPRRRSRWLLPSLIIGGLGAVLAAGALTAAVLMGSGDNGVRPPSPTNTSPQAAIRLIEPLEGAILAGSVKVQVDVTGINLKAPVENDPDGRHIHYFLDIDPRTVLAPGQPIPTGNQRIVHTAAASHTFIDLPTGQHSVWAVLTGNDHVPISIDAATKVTFSVINDPLAGARSGEDSLVLYQAFTEGKWRIFVMDGKGNNPKRLTGGNANYYNPSWSPDGTRIAFQSDRDGSSHIYLINPDGSDMKKLTDGAFEDRSPAWSPDGKEIVFVSKRDGRDHLWVVPVTGGEPRQITRGQTTDGAPHWSPDGTRIAYHADRGATTDIFIVDARGAGAPRQITDGPQRNSRPVWSPDGTRIAFHSFRDNAWNIYVMKADGTEVKKITEGTYNINPSWSPDGRHLLFQSDRDGGTQQIFVTPVEGGQATRLSDGQTISASPSWPLK